MSEPSASGWSRPLPDGGEPSTVTVSRDAAGPAVSACGAGIRPQRESSRTGQSAVEQETQPATVGIPCLLAGEEAKE
ncbi:hypothetical protein GCM10009736_56980 [Actinomadura bangladeshensis]